ncbi:exodeoxyribonuclease VII small subunit [Faecalibacterium prausnitzii]|uniref:exodeoxyribonuclease VII small subunit n=1 Tax=Faecalibacterium prausnitzii TaxID=853 RepID=UPI0022E3953D|nr:exodeoxyribonuclease VII small subunit [Faecalibacterium prausnitzii]
MKAPKSFEEGMDRLNTILAQMQQEDTSLADSVKLYAEAASLMQYCHAMLEKTSLQIEEISAKIAETVETPQEQEEE